MIRSEQTKDMSVKDINLLNKENEEIKEPDMMGFWGKEGIDDGSED